MKKRNIKNRHTPEHQTTRRILLTACGTALTLALTVLLPQSARTEGIRLKRDSPASVRYSERLNSRKSSFSVQRTDRYGIVDQERCHFQFDS
jgi:hypothetical protein